MLDSYTLGVACVTCQASDEGVEWPGTRLQWRRDDARRARLALAADRGPSVSRLREHGRRPGRRRPHPPRRHPGLRQPPALERVRVDARAFRSGPPARAGTAVTAGGRARPAPRRALSRGPLPHRQGADRGGDPKGRRAADPRPRAARGPPAPAARRAPAPARERLDLRSEAARPGALADRALGGECLRLGRGGPAQAVRRRVLRLAVPRHDTQPQPPVVPDGGLRQRGEGAAIQEASAARRARAKRASA